MFEHFAEYTGLQAPGQSSNGHALAVSCKVSNLHPVLSHVFLFCAQCDHPLSFVYMLSVVHSICLSSTLSCIFPITQSAISSSVRFIHVFTEPSWFLHHVYLVARHMHPQGSLAS